MDGKRISTISFLTITLILFCIGFSALSAFYLIPAYMDEPSSFHPIACRYFPNARLHSLREPCNGWYDLLWNGKAVWTRGFHYVGALNALFYLPFYLVWNNILSMRLYTFCWLSLLGLGWSRIVSAPFWLGLLVCFLQYDILHTTIREYGPTAALSAATFLVPLLFRQIIRARGVKYIAWSTLCGLTLFIPFEIKGIFVYSLPGIGLLCLSVMIAEHRRGIRWTTILMRCLPASFIGLLLTSILLNLRTAWGAPYWTELFGWNDKSGVIDLQHYLGHAIDMFNRYAFNIAGVNDVIHEPLSDSLRNLGLALSYCFWGAALGGCIYAYTISRDRNHQKPAVDILPYYNSICILAGLITLLLVTTNANSARAYHMLPAVIFLTAPIIQMLWHLYLQRRSVFLFLTSVFALSSACTAGILLKSQVKVSNSDDRLPIFELLRTPSVGDHYTIVHLDWGTYYVSALYGRKEQLVSYAEPMNEFHGTTGGYQLKDLRAVSAQIDRPLLFVGLNNPQNWQRLVSQVPTLHRIYPSDGQNSTWEVWAEELSTKGNTAKEIPEQ